MAGPLCPAQPIIPCPGGGCQATVTLLFSALHSSGISKGAPGAGNVRPRDDLISYRTAAIVGVEENRGEGRGRERSNTDLITLFDPVGGREAQDRS